MTTTRRSILFGIFATLATGCIVPGSGGSGGSDAEAQIAASLPTYTQYGWSGGAANGSGAGATFFPIIASHVSGNDVTIAYAWKNGVLTGTIIGNQIVGTWTQSNGYGPQTLTFDDDGQFISGWWADSDSGEHAPAFLE
jgi:hypothetical protein